MYKTTRTNVITLTILVLAFLAGSTAYAAPEPALKKAPSQDSVKFLKSLSDALSDVAEVVKPSVVNISTTSTVSMDDNQFGDMLNDPLFKKFFGEQFDHPGQKKKFKSSSLGSGVIVTENGYILTSNHVVKGAEDIKVILYDKREIKGKIVGVDPRTDLAVIKINANNLPVARLGESGKLKAGDVVLAIGTPFGLNQSITMGVVSAVGRSNVGIADLEDFIQTDAAINPGNSGGGLVNTNGEVIGINTAIFSTSGGYMGIGFAVPMDMAKTVMESIIKSGKVIRGWLGVSIQDLTPELAKSLNIKPQKGALVADVVKDSPAEKAGLKRGDVITDFGGKTVEDSTTLRNMVASTAPGKTVDMKIMRDGKEQNVSVTLTELKERKVTKKVQYNNVLKGITVQDLTASLKEKMGLPATASGAVITDVSQDSPAQNVLQPGDVILEVNRKEITGANDYDQIASKIGESDSVLLLIYREGGTLYITLRP